MLSPGSSQDSPSWLWGTVCTGTPQHVESEGWKDAPVTLKDIPSTSNPHPNLETSVSPHCTPGVVPGTAAGRTRIGTAGYPQRPPQPGHCAQAPQAWGSTFLPCQPLHPLLPAALPAEQAARCATLSLSHTQAALLCAAWLPTSRMNSEPCFVIYPHFMFSCAQLVPLPAFLPRTVLFTF